MVVGSATWQRLAWGGGHHETKRTHARWMPVLMSLGAWEWVCIVLELIIWLTFGSLIVQKFRVDVAEKRFVDSA